jgi:hypothetical protein
MEHRALDRARVLDADHHLGEQVLEHPRRREIVSRPDLAHVGHDRLARLRAVDGEAGKQRLGVGKQVVPHPGHRQVGQNLVVRAEPVEAAAAASRVDQRRMGDADALRLSGRAGGVEHDRHVAGFALRDLVPDEIRLLAHAAAPRLLHCIQAAQEGLLVMPQPTRIVVQNLFEPGGSLAALDQLVHLFLIFGNGEPDAGVLQHILQFLRHGILVHGHRNPAQALRRGHGPIEARTVVADDGKAVAAAEWSSAKPQASAPPPTPGSSSRSPGCRVFFAYRRALRRTAAAAAKPQTYPKTHLTYGPPSNVLRPCPGTLSESL